MLQPKRMKHRKVRKGKKGRKVASRGYEISFGSYGLKAMEPVWMTAAQIEAARRAITKQLKKGGKIWIRVFPDKPRTQKGAEVSMGGGTGSLSHFVAVVEAGRILFEVDGVEKELAKKAFKVASHKLPIKTQFVEK
jgi:large subunit ribosomal protein L16